MKEITLGRPQKTSPFCGEGVGTRAVVRGTGEGRGGEIEIDGRIQKNPRLR